MRDEWPVLHHGGDELADQQLLGARLSQRLHEGDELSGLDLREAGLLRVVALQLTTLAM